MADTTVSGLVDQIVRDLRGSWRYRWSALAVAWALCIVGWLAVLALPNVYQAQARVYVDTSSRLREVLGTIAFEPDIESRVNIVRQALLGRPQLERVAKTTGLFEGAVTKDDRERVIAGLRENITVAAGRTAASRNLFGISYESRDRQTAVAVVDTLLKSFENDVLTQKAQGADAAQQFLRDQIDHYSTLLAQADQRLADFKKENLGLLPGSDTDYFARLQAQTAAVEQLRSELKVAESKRDELKRQISGEQPFLPDTGAGSTATTVGAATGTPTVGTGTGLEIDGRIAALQKNLDDLLLRYTDVHPEVVGLREQIEELKKRRAEQIQAFMNGGLGVPGSNNPVYQNAQIALNQANVEIAALQAKIADGEAKTKELQDSVNTIPEVEAELARLTRDYANTKALYDKLVAQLERERLVNEGDDRQVVNFQIIDPPSAPVDPVSPKRLIMLLGVLVLGLGAGSALAYLLNMIKPSFIDAAQLRAVSGLPVLGSVSAAWSGRSQVVRRLEAVAYAGLVMVLVLVGGATVLLRDYGVHIMQRLFA